LMPNGDEAIGSFQKSLVQFVQLRASQKM